MWVNELPEIQKQHRERVNFDLFDKLNSFMSLLNPFNHVEDRVLFLNVVYKDILQILPEWITESEELSEPT